MFVQRAADLAGQLRDPHDDRLGRGDQSEHDRAPGLALKLVGASTGSAAQPSEQLGRCAPAAVVVAREEPGQPLLAQAMSVARAGVALEERQRDRAIDIGEHLGGAGPEALQLRAQLVGDPDAMADEILAGASQRAQRLRSVAVRDQDPETVPVGPGELGKHERVEAVALAARGTEPRSHRRDLVGMDRNHRKTRIEQPFDQQPVRTLDRHPRDAELDQPCAQRLDPTLVMTVAASFDDPPIAIVDAHRVLGAGPINSSGPTLTHNSSLQPTILTAAGDEVPWRLLIDGALRARLPVAAQGTSTDRREALVSRWPSARASNAGALPTAAGTTEDDQ